MKARLKRLLVFVVPIILAIALVFGAGLEWDTDSYDGVLAGDFGDYVGIDDYDGVLAGDFGDYVGIDDYDGVLAGDFGDYVGIDGFEL